MFKKFRFMWSVASVLYVTSLSVKGFAALASQVKDYFQQRNAEKRELTLK